MSKTIARVSTIDGPVQVDTFAGPNRRPMVQITGVPKLAGAVQVDRIAFVTLMRAAVAAIESERDAEHADDTADRLTRAIRELEILFGAAGTTWPQMRDAIDKLVHAAARDAMVVLADSLRDNFDGSPDGR